MPISYFLRMIRFGMTGPYRLVYLGKQFRGQYRVREWDLLVDEYSVGRVFGDI